jgi:hypothetical protein
VYKAGEWDKFCGGPGGFGFGVGPSGNYERGGLCFVPSGRAEVPRLECSEKRDGEWALL